MNADGSPRKLAIRVLGGDFTGAQADAEKARQLLEERLRERPNERVSIDDELIWVYLALKRDSRRAQTRAAGCGLTCRRREMRCRR